MLKVLRVIYTGRFSSLTVCRPTVVVSPALSRAFACFEAAIGRRSGLVLGARRYCSCLGFLHGIQGLLLHRLSF